MNKLFNSNASNTKSNTLVPTPVKAGEKNFKQTAAEQRALASMKRTCKRDVCQRATQCGRPSSLCRQLTVSAAFCGLH